MHNCSGNWSQVCTSPAGRVSPQSVFTADGGPSETCTAQGADVKERQLPGEAHSPPPGGGSQAAPKLAQTNGSIESCAAFYNQSWVWRDSFLPEKMLSNTIISGKQ